MPVGGAVGKRTWLVGTRHHRVWLSLAKGGDPGSRQTWRTVHSVASAGHRRTSTAWSHLREAPWRGRIQRDGRDAGFWGQGQGRAVSVYWGRTFVRKVESSGDDGGDGHTTVRCT